jgi:hypothetical protein
MAFRVIHSSGHRTEFGVDDIYEFLFGGVLAVHYADPTKWSEYYPPHKWDQVLAEAGHRPGATGGESVGGLMLGEWPHASSRVV